MLAGYLQQNQRPDLKPFGSFESWSNTVRACIKWLGFDDPVISNQELRKEGDPQTEGIANLLRLLYETFGDDEFTSGELLEEKNGCESQFRGALAEIVPRRLDARSVGNAFRKYRGRIFGRSSCGSTRTSSWILSYPTLTLRAASSPSRAVRGLSRHTNALMNWFWNRIVSLEWRFNTDIRVSRNAHSDRPSGRDSASFPIVQERLRSTPRDVETALGVLLLFHHEW